MAYYRYLFPFDEVNKGAKIVIYGGGDVGRQYLSQIISLDYCTCLFIADRDYEKYNKIAGIEVYAPEQIKSCNYDKIVIAADIYNNEIYTSLLVLNVPEEKIVRKLVAADAIENIAAKFVLKQDSQKYSFRTIFPYTLPFYIIGLFIVLILFLK